MTDDDRTGQMVRFHPSAAGTPCPMCGRSYQVGAHMIRGSAGEKCRAPGCKAKLFERCEVDGVEVAWACLGGGHRWRAPK